MPTLSILRLTPSFSDLWASLADEIGLTLHLADDLEALQRHRGALALIAAGGEEAAAAALLAGRAGLATEVAVVGALPSHRVAVTLLRAGASEYFALPDDLELLRSWLQSRVAREEARQSAAAFADAERAKYTFDGILGESAALRAALERAARIIPHGAVTVLIAGETGTGKELLARAIHYNGPRRAAPFVDINCAAIPEHLLESELFGHEKGAFTDATSTKPGLFELADQGTLFLDEIGHLALPLQGKLLRALEERKIRRVGGARAIPIDVRVVAATHVDLAAASRDGRFRDDLYYRLNVVPLMLPALRERRSDIPLLVHHFAARFANDYGLPMPAITAAAHHALRDHPWPGNIRELRNVLERAVLLCHDGRIDVSDLSLSPGPEQSHDGGALPFPSTMAVLTRAAAHAMLRLCDGNKSETARRLGISRPRLLRLLSEDSSTNRESTPGVDDAE